MRISIGISAMLLGASACSSSGTALEPATPIAPVASGIVQIDSDTVVDTSGDVSVKAEVDAWPGDPGVLEEVTPIRVTLRNDSDQPVRVQYRRFQLVASNGERYRALPPFEITGSIHEPRLARRYSFADRDLHYPGFYIDPMYAGVWPGMQPYGPLADYDPAFYTDGYAFWRRALPTPEMRRRVLPEGVLEPDGRVSGFLYFQKIDPESGRVRLVSELVNAENGQRVTTSRIPFRLEEG